ncbi:MAG: M48 family metallopeptidase [Acidobacteria bacterium]|nr:M48 family metallopeptidase [Acidobacteriota bacterium]
MNLYEQQQANRRNTKVVVAVFILFFAFLGFGFDFFYFGFNPWSNRVAVGGLDDEGPAPGIGFPVATVIALLFGSGQAWWGMRFGDRAVLSAASAVPVDPATNDLPQRQLLNIVEEMKIASGLPMPKVYLIPDSDPNAFATGPDPEHASIAVTRGLIEKLNREELQGVIAHEMSHVRNLDIRLMTTIAALVGGVVLLSDWAGRSMRFGGGRSRSSRRSKSGGGAGMILLLLWIIAVVLAPILARILAMAVSRQREYLADASGAELTRNPAGLAAALKKIETDYSPMHSIKKGTAHLCIADPLGRKMGLREGFWADLLATHPPMPHRISKLMQMAYQAAPHSAGP